jgi:hypothetical protein
VVLKTTVSLKWLSAEKWTVAQKSCGLAAAVAAVRKTSKAGPIAQ